MIRPRPLFFLTLFVLSVAAASAAPWSYSLGVSVQDITWEDEDAGGERVFVQEQAAGLDVRGSAILPNTDFYYGTFINLSAPFVRVVDHPEAEDLDYSSPTYNLSAAVGIPLGWRWRIADERMGLYVGAGPAFQMLFDFDDHWQGSGGLVLEFGLETLKTEGVGISVGTRAILPFGAFSVAAGRDEVADPVLPVGATFHVGISWTGERD